MRLIMNDGTAYENAGAGNAGNTLWLTIPGITMQDAAEIAFDEGKTRRITHQYGPEQDVYEGYTRCTRLMDETENISICLVKG